MTAIIPADAASAPKGPFGGRPASIQVQSVLYGNDIADVRRALASLWRAAELAIGEGVCTQVAIRYGDSSPARCLSDEELAALRAEFSGALTIEYDFFDSNLGSARGHNRLASAATTDFLLIQNPDVVVSPRLFEMLLEPFRRPDVGMTEAKQLPIEHPKEYDPATGETCWATTACAMIPRSLFEALGGFDADTFFLYCDDVDFSWLVRRAGFRVIFQPAAVVFHDKRLTDDGAWRPTNSERYFSAEAALLLPVKWSRPDVTRRILDLYKEIGDEHQRKAVTEYERRAAEGRLPTPLDPDHRVGQFVGDMYAKHRYII